MDLNVSSLESYLRNNIIDDYDELYADIDDEQVIDSIKRRSRQPIADLSRMGPNVTE